MSQCSALTTEEAGGGRWEDLSGPRSECTLPTPAFWTFRLQSCDRTLCYGSRGSQTGTYGGLSAELTEASVSDKGREFITPDVRAQFPSGNSSLPEDGWVSPSPCTGTCVKLSLPQMLLPGCGFFCHSATWNTDRRGEPDPTIQPS